MPRFRLGGLAPPIDCIVLIMRKIIIKNRGLTTLEIMVSVSIIAVLIALAVPSFSRTIDKQRLTGACHEVFEHLAYARSTAIKLNKSISVSFKPNPFYFAPHNNEQAELYNWCIGLNDASVSGCNCAGSGSEVAKCTVNGRQEVVRFPKQSNTTIYQNDVTFSGRNKTTFNSRDGTASAGHVSLGSMMWACKITLSSMGRVRFEKSASGDFIVPLDQLSSLE